MKSNLKKAIDVIISLLAVAMIGFGLFMIMFGNVERRKLESKQAGYARIIRDMENDAEHDRVANMVLHDDGSRLSAKVQ